MTDNETLNWCDECQKWHRENALTICLMRKAYRRLCDIDEPDEKNLLGPERPWRKVLNDDEN